MRNKSLLGTALVVMALVTGCGANNTASTTGTTSSGSTASTSESTLADNRVSEGNTTSSGNNQADSTDGEAQDENSALPNIYLRLGETASRPSFEIALEDNEVSVRFVRILQDMTRVIPLYVFDGSQNTDVLQYYDIPSRYDIPDGTPELVTSEKAGEVYYSAGRIMIFYKDAQIEGNFVKIGETLTTEGLEDAVNSNPLDDWGNRRVTIGIMQ